MAHPELESPSVASDLRWYFTREATGPLRSNFGGMVYRLAMGRARRDSPPSEPSDESLDEAARSGGIARVLRSLDAENADILWRAFGAERQDELGGLEDLAALAPITAAAVSAHRRSKTPRALEEWLAAFIEHPERAQSQTETLDRIKRDARALRSRALTAYLSQRRRIGAHA